LLNVAGNVSGKGGAFRISDGDEAAGYIRLLENFGDEFTGLGTQSTAGDMQMVVVNFDHDFCVRGHDETKEEGEKPERGESDYYQKPPDVHV
jgi:hypothetical protein